CQQHNRYFPTF
nr:immunoglobulin light chain junction region [Macaca mulatta]